MKKINMKKQNMSNTSETVLKTTLHTLHSHLLTSILLLLTAVGVIAASLLPPQILKRIVDSYLSDTATSALLKIAFLYFGSQILISLFTLAKETILAYLGQQITKQLRSDMLKKMTRLPSLYFSNTPSGTTTALFMGDVDAIQSLFSNGIISLFIDLCKIIGIVVSVWFFSPSFGVLFIVILPLIFLLTRYFKNKMFSAQVKSRKLLSIVANYIPESLHNASIIKAYHSEDFMEKRYDGLIDKTYDEQEHINFYDSVFSPIIQVLRALTICLIAVFAARKAPGLFSGMSVTVGMAAAAIEYVSSVFKPVESLGMEIQNIQSSFAGITRVNEFFALAEKRTPVASFDTSFVTNVNAHENTTTSLVANNKLHADKNEPLITFDSVSFTYPSSDEKVLDDVSFTIQRGEHVTFRGRTGAGKSTLFRLILGQLSCTNGNLKIGPYDADSIPDEMKRSLFGYVEQSFRFVPGTIRNQITLGDDTITDEHIQRALQTAGLSDTTSRFTNGLDTPADKQLFSQGQLQLLSIARAIVKDPPILLLDEITANLDSATERMIIEALENAGKGRTQLCISHRLGAVLASDRIMYLSDGKCTARES